MTGEPLSPLQEALGAEYRIERPIEGGGMSRLFLATDVRHNRKVVVKVLPPELETPMSLARFKREIELTVRLQHPHILPIITSGEYSGGSYYITPYIEGESLRARIQREGKLDLDAVIKILIDIGSALLFAHSRGIEHRDVKPGNILLSTDGHAILADFGIARLVDATGTPLTDSGMRPGTPAYMPPEVITGEAADVYALGMVGYEMLAGHLRRPGEPTAEAYAVKRVRKGDSRRRLNAIYRVLARATAHHAEDRFQSAAEFQDALRLASSRAPRGLAWTSAAIAATAIAASASTLRQRAAESPTNAESYAILPPAENQIDSALASEFRVKLANAMSRWNGVNVIEPAATDAVVSARSVASGDRKPYRALGTHFVIKSSLSRLPDSIEVESQVIDIRGDRVVRDIRQRIAPEKLDALASPFAVRILVADDDRVVSVARPFARSSLASWRAYAEGRASLDAWNLPMAETSFRSALTADPTNASAGLWLSETLRLAARPGSDIERRDLARRAYDARSRLSPADTLLSIAAFRLAVGNPEAACKAYRAMVASDSTNLLSWVGLGDCQQMDSTVVRSAKSPSGLMFRSGLESASRAYQRAGELAPVTSDSGFRGWLLGRLSAVLFTTTYRVRMGYLVEKDTTRCLGYPFLDGDTIAVIPFPQSKIASGEGDQPIDQRNAAITRNRQLLQRQAEEWVQRFPSNAAAYDSLATLAEISNDVAKVGESRYTPLEIVRRARALTSKPSNKRRLAVAEVRLRLKSGDFRGARVTADSILRETRASGSADPTTAGLAALTGRVTETARFLRLQGVEALMPAGQSLSPPAAVREAALSLLAFASFGDMAVDSVAAWQEQLIELLSSYYPDTARRNDASRALLIPALSLRFPTDQSTLARQGLSATLMYSAQQEFARGNRGAAAVELARIRRSSGVYLPGSVSADGILAQATLALAIGDTAGATVELDRMLRALPTLGVFLLDHVPHITSLVRAMILRSKIAETAHDGPTARYWATAVRDLWGSRDSDTAVFLDSLLPKDK